MAAISYQLAVVSCQLEAKTQSIDVSAVTSPPGPLRQSYQLSVVSCQLKSKS